MKERRLGCLWTRKLRQSLTSLSHVHVSIYFALMCTFQLKRASFVAGEKGCKIIERTCALNSVQEAGESLELGTKLRIPVRCETKEEDAWNVIATTFDHVGIHRDEEVGAFGAPTVALFTERLLRLILDLQKVLASLRDAWERKHRILLLLWRPIMHVRSA
jgi:hypothetical protein